MIELKITIADNVDNEMGEVAGAFVLYNAAGEAFSPFDNLQDAGDKILEEYGWEDAMEEGSVCCFVEWRGEIYSLAFYEDGDELVWELGDEC